MIWGRGAPLPEAPPHATNYDNWVQNQTGLNHSEDQGPSGGRESLLVVPEQGQVPTDAGPASWLTRLTRRDIYFLLSGMTVVMIVEGITWAALALLRK